MKKALLVLFTAVLLTGCKNALDKKIEKEHFLDDMKEIEAKDTGAYSQKDFQTLTLGLGMSTVTGLAQAWNGTYRQALDEIKAKRIKAEADSIKKETQYESDLRLFHNKVAVLLQAIGLKATGKTMKDGDDMGLSQVFNISVTVDNTSGQGITLYQGTLHVTDAAGNELTNFTVGSTEGMAAGASSLSICTLAYSDTDEGQTKVKDADFADLRFEWQPTKIVFQNGNTLTAPAMPEKPTFTAE